MAGIRSVLIVFIHTPVPKEDAGALPKPGEIGRNDNVVQFTQKNILAGTKENLSTWLVATGSEGMAEHMVIKTICQSALYKKMTTVIIYYYNACLQRLAAAGDFLSTWLPIGSRSGVPDKSNRAACTRWRPDKPAAHDTE